MVQVDLTAYVAPNADLICWSRLGSSYDQADLEDLIEQRTVDELRGMLRPAEDIALLRTEMERRPGPESRGPAGGTASTPPALHPRCRSSCW